ncbi:MAG: hypothetical protein U0003_03795 [Vampirovibrionales bacterium]
MPATSPPLTTSPITPPLWGLNPWVLTGLLAVAACLVCLGWRLRQKSQSHPSFFNANKTFGPLFVAFSYIASWFGAASTLATCQGVAMRG